MRNSLHYRRFHSKLDSIAVVRICSAEESRPLVSHPGGLPGSLKRPAGFQRIFPTLAYLTNLGLAVKTE